MDEPMRTNITLLSELSMQSNLLKESLESNLDVTVNITPFSSVVDKNVITRPISNIVLIDFSHINDEDFLTYTQLRSQSSGVIKEVLINCPSDIQSSRLFKWRDLVGVFYIEDDIRCFAKGMTKILSDEMWLSRKVAQDYIQHFRGTNTVSTSQAYKQLTKREKQIIQLLGHGASNIQIAQELFVSENTVKTHLHNIFKKINAKNRLQALLWANNNIGIEERA
ncbi:helix-turn-helix transcriptional regulator [Vibrio sp. SCSIO 43135]|uniref:LuxR C-terminal-related transcriptional regulator n=1 Tax=Vibrio sp. SCSIO 43135 TaxID=2819096 RepID=UPI0020751C93|nr:LuxR C-terminal-related transcriptional regulator [Vibrio sp. SCSIO 43135]USD43128.1 helix-turn-helix transcriptional regulator [Vibrio sp. SCSIO 43135]